MEPIEPQCWMCGDPADSSEHRFKRADLVRAHGRGPYRGKAELVHVREGVSTPVQGPGSATFKYPPSLCHGCNTARTQPFDRAYDQLIEWVFVNESQVLRKRLIDFEEVYGNGWAEAQTNLFKYFVKSFGCRLVVAGQPVPQDLVDLLPLEQFQTALRITFSVNEDVLLLPPSVQSGFHGKADLYAELSKSDPTVLYGYLWSERVSWFTVNYWYWRLPEGGMGSTWIADSQHVYLGSYESALTDEQRVTLLSDTGEA